MDIYGGVFTEEAAGEVDVPFRYPGQYFDRETGLCYNRFRYYDPAEGLYISVDPIGLAGGNPTLYGYVKDPTIWVDEFGLNPLIGLDLGNMDQRQISTVLSMEPDIAYHGGSPNGDFMQWKYISTQTVAVKIHPPDNVGTPFHHAHLYDTAANPLDINGNIVAYDTPDAHISIKQSCSL